MRRLPYNLTSLLTTELIAETLWKDIRERLLFVSSAKSISLETPIEATPHDHCGEEESRKNGDHTPSRD